MKRFLLGVALMVSISGPAIAVDSDGGYVVRGAGTQSCGAWVAEKEKEGWGRVIFTAWLAGYVSGVNAFVYGKADWAEGTDMYGLVAWVDNYCGSSPLDKISRAAAALVFHLRTR